MTGTGEAMIASMISRVLVRSPPGVSSLRISTSACIARAFAIDLLT